MKVRKTDLYLTLLVFLVLSLFTIFSPNAAAEVNDKVSSGVLLEQSLPSPIEVGKTFEYEIKVTNPTSVTLENLVVTEKLASTFKFISAVPHPRSPQGIVWTLPDIAFDFGSHKIRDEYRQLIGQAAKAIIGNPDAQLIVKGYTDDVGENSYNLALSRERAKAVKTYLASEFRANNAQISVIGLGEARPIVANDSAANQSKNRRVEIELIGERSDSDMLQWMLGTLDSGESKVMKITGMASQIGALTNCTTVAYKTGLCSTIEVIKPDLQLVKTAPDAVLLCDPIPLAFVVSNPGSVPIDNVVIQDALPEGFAALDGQTIVSFNVGTLQVGQSRNFTVTVKANSPGTYQWAATATADGGWRAESTTQTIVREPILTIAHTGTEKVDLHGQIEYQISIGNTGDGVADNAVLEDIIPSGTSFISASEGGQFDVIEGKVIWELGSIPPSDSRSFTITVKAELIGKLRTTARLDAVCAKPVSAVAVTEVVGVPELTLKKESPAEVLVCDLIPLTYTVTNPGTGTIGGVVINDSLPEGLVTTESQTAVTFNVGTLEPGQSRVISVNTKASRTGTYTSTATAIADRGLKADSTAETTVRKPVLTLTQNAPTQQITSRNVTYDITVENTGDAVAANTVLEELISSGSSFVIASEGGLFDEKTGKIVWNLGDLEPNTKESLSVTVKAGQLGVIRATLSANAVCATATAATTTEIIGIPAVLLELIDLEDPVEVGNNETYEITTLNQGTAPDTNISITCTLEDEVEYVSSTGDTEGKIEGNVLTFAPYKSLPPKGKATWRVTVKATAAGDTRFKVAMNADALSRPVEETEATQIYD